MVREAKGACRALWGLVGSQRLAVRARRRVLDSVALRRPRRRTSRTLRRMLHPAQVAVPLSNKVVKDKDNLKARAKGLLVKVVRKDKASMVGTGLAVVLEVPARVVSVEDRSKADTTNKPLLILGILKGAMSPTSTDISRGNSRAIGSDQ